MTILIVFSYNSKDLGSICFYLENYLQKKR